MKNISKIIFVTFFSVFVLNTNAQEITILFKNDTLQLVQYFYPKLPDPNQKEVGCSSTTKVFFIKKNTPNDTIIRSACGKITEALYDGVYLGTIFNVDGVLAEYELMAKIDKDWVQIISSTMSIFDRDAEYYLNLEDIYHVKGHYRTKETDKNYDIVVDTKNQTIKQRVTSKTEALVERTFPIENIESRRQKIKTSIKN